MLRIFDDMCLKKGFDIRYSGLGNSKLEALRL